MPSNRVVGENAGCWVLGGVGNRGGQGIPGGSDGDGADRDGHALTRVRFSCPCGKVNPTYCKGIAPTIGGMAIALSAMGGIGKLPSSLAEQHSEMERTHGKGVIGARSDRGSRDGSLVHCDEGSRSISRKGELLLPIQYMGCYIFRDRD